ncbi:GNAT family N-acetyltransferase, partial [Acinetobacter nosocomialis]|uniref:GNAT family N-acetyltransferase n=1 Tax=Acinetobacter nosocomialis TaxID=106654 RepID=UPI001D17F96E
CYPKAIWPFSVAQLAAAIAERRGSTVAVHDGQVLGFANFYQWQHGDFCALGNMMVAPAARHRRTPRSGRPARGADPD